ncbi:MAG: CpsD/CapB family tyrosine-protein kinase [Caloramator sp.]|jgi:capsular exopolysaccharide synthesis family protein|uniref:CpsD/CapB family tyrosine-protein kinase n=1 Tax=Caloramator sp. TaxID=1871330 RepID=UPI001DE6297B|nr:CpsD/CapB family tyrosine-protein kinase [Caloramator sp.]MBZ4663239.1 CpsD/CapB family tyrosine-protein kinase [Caloramator sp.]
MSNFIVEKNPKSPISESYRTLRTNIQFSSFDKDIKTIVVTSSAPGEGKSTTVGNLALVMAQSGKRVLLIDADLRKPTVHKKFKLSNQTGLTNILIEDKNPFEVIQKYSDNLYILTSGILPPNPAEVVASNKLRNFINEMKNHFDYILLNSPPVIAVTDAQILSSFLDGVILVVSSGEAEKELVKKSKDLLDKVNANIIGVVLNKLELKSRKGYGYYYYYYGEEGSAKK